MKILIAGGTGFVGRNLLPHLLGKAATIRLLVRDKEKAKRLFVSDLELIEGDITKPESLQQACRDIDAVIHLVGIINEKGRNNFETVHVKGTEALVKAAIEAQVKSFFYQSALGATLDSPFRYLKTKAQAEQIVINSGLRYLIFRPSLILGPGDGFSESIVSLIKSAPVVPLPAGGKTMFQPIFIDDWCRAFMNSFFSETHWNKIYEFGGPEHISYKRMLHAYMAQMNIRKPVISVPIGLMKLSLPLTSVARIMRIKIPEVTAEQLGLLSIDNITDPQSCLKHFGFKPRKFEEFLPEVLTKKL